MPSSALVIRKAGGRPLEYVQYATAPSASTATIMNIVAMAVDSFLWFPSAR
jgi:hypothetical protein